MTERGAKACGQKKKPSGKSPSPAKITLLYESRDGKLCLFEDAHGHLVTVRSSRLA